MDGYGREPVKLKPRIILRNTAEVQTEIPVVQQPTQPTQNLTGLVRSAHVQSIFLAQEAGYIIVWTQISGNPEFTLSGRGATVTEAMMDLDRNIQEMGFTL